MNQDFLKKHSMASLPEINERNQRDANVVEEIDKRSHFLENASYIESSGENSHKFVRRDEMRMDASTAYEDEGYAIEKAQGNAEEIEVRMGIVRVAYSYDPLIMRAAEDGGRAYLEEQNKAMIDGVADKIVQLDLQNGGSVKDPKWDRGIITWLDEISDWRAMAKDAKLGINPFKKEKCLTLSNIDGASETALATIKKAKSESKFTSIFALDWGPHKISLLYPRKFGYLGYQIEQIDPSTYEYLDTYDGRQKIRDRGYARTEARSGVVVENRFALAGIRNIFLEHENAEDMRDEMKRVVDNLARIVQFRSYGKNAGPIRFICSPELLLQMRRYQIEKNISIQSAPNQNLEFSDIAGFDSLAITPSIVLYAEKLMDDSEALVGELAE